jgi:hypothetical protein
MRTTGIVLIVLGGVSVLAVLGVVLNSNPEDSRTAPRILGAAIWPVALVTIGLVLIFRGVPPQGPPQGPIGRCPRCRGEVLRTLSSCPHCGYQPGLSRSSAGAPPPTHQV